VDQFEDCDTDVATDEVREADWVSAAPNALTECQRVRCERPRECKGGTADAYKESRLRRASGPPSSSEHRGEAYTPNAATGRATLWRAPTHGSVGWPANEAGTAQ
jgi:hypothetical protein